VKDPQPKTVEKPKVMIKDQENEVPEKEPSFPQDDLMKEEGEVEKQGQTCS